MKSIGICGSDVHYWKKGAIGDFVVKAPMILGHESAGIVEEIGSQVKHLQPGDRVTLEPGVPCRFCDHCKGGRYNLCADVQFLATPPVHGSLADFHVHAADFAFKIPEHVSFDEAALIEPLSVGLHACRRAGVSLGKTVLITGAGPIGLVNILTAKACGATTVIVSDVNEFRLETAKRIGADVVYTVNGNTSLVEFCKQNCLSPDVSIECSGAESAITSCIRATKSGGVVVLVGLGPAVVNIPIVDAAVREVDIRGVFRYANTYPTAISLVASGKIDLKPLITHRYSLDSMLEAFETAHGDRGNAIKVVINP